MPSLKPSSRLEVDVEHGEFHLPLPGHLPPYDLRRLITARDPLCCVNAFLVSCKVVLPALYGFRMCPQCPHCAMSESPCMDIFGSNATPMGGGAGRCDAIIGAVEAQKAQGILHLHFFMYIQTLLQFLTLQEIADKLRDGIITSENWKEYVSYVRCAAYPDAEKAEKDRSDVEKTWPAYTTVDTLARLSATLWEDTAGTTSPHFLHQDFERAAWEIDAANWLKTYDARLQEALLYMNHHIHPLINDETGERRVLPSCQPKDKSNTCKGGFPLETELTETPLLVCKCIADARGLVQRGPRSLLGTVLPRRNSAWLNADRKHLQKWRAAGEKDRPSLLCIGCEKAHER